MATAFAREMQPDPSEIVLENKKVIVEKAHIVGIDRTKSDFVVDELRPILTCCYFLDAYKAALAARERLLSKGIFSSVDIYLDTTEAYKNRSENGIQVLFKVKEYSLLRGEAKTEMSNRDKPRWTMRLVSSNIMGRGESVATAISHTFNSSCGTRVYQPTEFTTSFTKPFKNGSIAHFTLLKDIQENPWSCCKEITRGGQLGYSFPLYGNHHTVEYLGHWRQLACVSGKAPLDLRKQLGHSLKSSIKHSMVYDRTDDPILTKTGKYVKLTEEFAGLGGSVQFIKEILEASYHHTICDRITLGAGINCGIMFPYGGKPTTYLLNDKFFIGGPLTLRGFEMNRVGNARLGTFLGSNCFWVAGCHIYLPLPFHWTCFGQGSWLDNFRMHGFLNAGNVFDFDFRAGPAENLRLVHHKSRLSYGAGVVYKFADMARIELNFCVPLRAQSTDFTCSGLQFGIGISTV